MSILEDVTQLASEKDKAITISKIITDGHASLLEAFNNAVWLVWGSEDPQAVITELGNKAASVFAASEAAAICLETVSPGCTAAILATRGTYTVNPDGTITNAVKPVAP